MIAVALVSALLAGGAQAAIGGYEYLGTGYCDSGYYAGWKAEDAKTVFTCAAKCNSEPQCKFFALKQGATCSRYKEATCRRTRNMDHLTYKKLPIPHLADYQYLGVGYCKKGYRAGWNHEDAKDYETCKRKCDSESWCKHFSLVLGRTCSRYDSRAGTCESRTNNADHLTYSKMTHVKGYEYLGQGVCKKGYYAGWTNAKVEARSVEACRDKCSSEPKCRYFSIIVGKTCSRWDSRAGSCTSRIKHDTSHSTFKRLPFGGRSAIDAAVDGSSRVTVIVVAAGAAVMMVACAGLAMWKRKAAGYAVIDEQMAI